MVKNLPTMRETWGSIPGLGRSPGRGHGNPLQYSCLENPHGQRSLAGYDSPWGHKESDTTEKVSTGDLAENKDGKKPVMTFRHVLQLCPKLDLALHFQLR